MKKLVIGMEPETSKLRKLLEEAVVELETKFPIGGTSQERRLIAFGILIAAFEHVPQEESAPFLEHFRRKYVSAT